MTATPARESVSSVALIARADASGRRRLWLARWNEHWDAYNFVAGHRLATESFRQCILREIGEELALRGDEFTVAAEPRAIARFTDWSHSAQAQTAYTLALFEVELSEAAHRHVDADPQTCWLTEEEIGTCLSTDGRPVSFTMSRLLTEAGLWTKETPMAARVVWMAKPRGKVAPDIRLRSTRELQAVFTSAGAITVYDCFMGYSADQNAKLVLGVEVRQKDAIETHVVKLGTVETTGSDVTGWRRCVFAHNCTSRLLVPVWGRALPAKRCAAVYRDARVLFGPDPGEQGPRDLETVVQWAVKDDGPDPISVERVLCQIYSDLARWLYADAQPSATDTRKFYNRLLKRALPVWSKEAARMEMRRNAAWELCEQDDPLSEREIRYLDPCDLVNWALAADERMPETLVGRSHGDLHGRNILVGVQRGEAEFPALFDYGAMGERNVVVWDFVKLETELKVRLLNALCGAKQVRDVLLRDYVKRRASDLPAQGDGQPDEGIPHSRAVRRIACNFEFESRLAEMTEEIGQSINVQSTGTRHRPDFEPDWTACQPLDRAIWVLMRIRQEAALWLGRRHPGAGRGRRRTWKDEYYFALACYGLCTAKYDYEGFWTEHALISAGVAAARCGFARQAIRDMLEPAANVPHTHPGKRKSAGQPYPSYHVPLSHAHRLWKGKRTSTRIARAVALLADAGKRYPYSVQILQEYALVLAETGDDETALELLEPLADMCQVFRDAETLSRIGRLSKDLGDQALEHNPVEVTELAGHPARQWYRTALSRYRKAFAIHRDYYPGINAASLCLLVDRHDEMQTLAKEVAKRCDELLPGAMSHSNRYWLLGTEGEANLLLGRETLARNFYAQALAVLHDDEHGMAQSTYGQLCRLHWAFRGFGHVETIEPVIELFRTCRFTLKPGPLGNCGIPRKLRRTRGGAAAATPKRKPAPRATRPTQRRRTKRK